MGRISANRKGRPRHLKSEGRLQEGEEDMANVTVYTNIG
jgi:hypothetical protein